MSEPIVIQPAVTELHVAPTVAEIDVVVTPVQVGVQPVQPQLNVLGTTGPRGEQGPPGEGITAIFEQLAPLDLWVWNHGLGKRPAISVVSLAEKVVNAAVTYLSDDSVQIEFTAPFSGRAYAN